MHGLDRHRANDRDRETLRRIVALLLWFAALAERAVARSLPVRIVLFWVLRRAELAARSLFIDPADEFDVPMASPCRIDDGTYEDGLIRLAVSFRVMAALLGAQLSAASARETCIVARTDGVGVRFRLYAIVRGFDAGLPHFHDTS